MNIYKFISYYPLKQGLKLIDHIPKIWTISEFISYYPLKQGLKLAIHDIIQTPRHTNLYPTIH